MVLHHIEDPELTLKEVHRILKSGGQLIIRETNAHTRDIFMVNEFLDKMFYAIFSDSKDVPPPNFYRSLIEWREYIETFGLEFVKFEIVEQGNPFQPFHMVFRKK